MSKHRVFVVNAHPGGNKGAEAMLETVVRELLSWDGFSERYDVWLETINETPEHAKICARLGIDMKLFAFKPKSFGAAYDLDLRAGDVVLDVGGINFHDKSSMANLRNYRRHSFFMRRGIKRIFYTQDFGPAQKLITRLCARRILSHADMVFSRSAVSKEMLHKTVPAVTAVGPFPDCTLMLAPAAPNGPMPEGPYSVFVPSAIMWNQHGEAYYDLLTQLAIAVPQDHSIVVLAHNFTPNDGSIDVDICTELHKRIAAHRPAELRTASDTPAELKGVLAGAQSVITSRFHAMVGAMACNVPAFAIGWSHKYEEFMANYGLADFTFDMKRLPEDATARRSLAEDIMKKVLEDVDRATLQSGNGDLKARVRSSFDTLRKVIMGA